MILNWVFTLMKTLIVWLSAYFITENLDATSNERIIMMMTMIMAKVYACTKFTMNI